MPKKPIRNNPKTNGEIRNDSTKSKISLYLSILIIGIGGIGLASTFFDILPLDDTKIEPFERLYVIKEITGMSIRENVLPDGNKTQTMTMSSEMFTFAKLSGLIAFSTDSKSARNPIDIQILLEPDDSISLSTDWEAMPETLHFVFPEAKKYSEKAVIRFYDEVEIELKKINDNDPRYFGNEILYYEDAGEYDFYLKESKEQEENVNVIENDDGTVDIQLFFPIEEDAPLGLRIFEIKKLENEKLIIEPYGQTITLNSYKLGAYLGFGSFLIAGVFAFRKYR